MTTFCAPPLTPDWLTARPIAHRGLHDRAQGRIENSLLAARAARARGFAVECDVQLSADGEALVFHDFDLRRLTGREGRIGDLTAAEAARVALTDGGGDTIPTLAALLDELAGAVPLIVEIKSAFDGDLRLAERVAQIVGAREAPVAIKSFDPAPLARLRALEAKGDARPGLAPRPIGLVAEAVCEGGDWAGLTPQQRRELPALTGFADVRPDFLSWSVGDLPHAAPNLFRAALGRPVMTWTVRRPEQRALAQRWADQIVFEGFDPI